MKNDDFVGLFIKNFEGFPQIEGRLSDPQRGFFDHGKYRKYTNIKLVLSEWRERYSNLWFLFLTRSDTLLTETDG